MNPSSAHLDELAEARALIVRLWDANLTPAEQGRLEALMLRRADVRLLYSEMTRLHLALCWRFRRNSISTRTPRQAPPF